MTLKAFVKKVNDIARKECEEINKVYYEGKAIFGAKHYDYPESLLKHYYSMGLSPQETLKEMEYENMAEAYAEAMCS